MRREYRRFLLALLAASLFSLPSDGKIVPRRDPADGALDATLVVIMQQHSKDLFAVREVFLGGITRGDLNLVIFLSSYLAASYFKSADARCDRKVILQVQADPISSPFPPLRMPASRKGPLTAPVSAS